MLYLDYNQITDFSLFPDSVYSLLTKLVIGQKITHDSVNEGDITEEVFIRIRYGQVPSNMSFIPTGGSYHIE